MHRLASRIIEDIDIISRIERAIFQATDETVRTDVFVRLNVKGTSSVKSPYRTSATAVALASRSILCVRSL